MQGALLWRLFPYYSPGAGPRPALGPIIVPVLPGGADAGGWATGGLIGMGQHAYNFMGPTIWHGQGLTRAG